MLRTIHSFLSDESGATAIEYALIASVMGVGLIVALQSMRTNIAGVFNTIGTTLRNSN